MSLVPREPLLVEATRGELAESRHRVRAALCDSAGRLLAAWGEVEAPVYPRSAIKPIQALPLVESGAAERYGLTDAHLALACASHGGAPGHIAALSEWLARTGLSAGDLQCGAHPPLDQAAAAALEREGAPPSPLHNNCAGKHLGFLTLARHRGEPLADYLAPSHPVERRWRATLAELAACDLSDAPEGIDGCGIPVVGLPLVGLARALARFADPSGLAPERRHAVERLGRAMACAPDMVAGRGRLDSEVIAASGGAVLLKGGAEGVAVAALRARGLGLALKVEDGAKRAQEAAALALLEHLGALPGALLAEFKLRHGARILNWAGRAVGEIRVVLP